MKKKLMCIFMCMLMIFSGMTTIFYQYIFNVKASEEESPGRVGLDYDFIYNTVTKYLSEIIFDSEYGIDNEIWKGRCFGTKGEQESANAILTWITQNTNNLNVLQIKKERVGNESDNLPNFSPMKRVNNNMEILSYSVDLREGYSSTPDVIISNNESFIFPIKKTKDQEWYERTITSNGPIKIRWPPIGYKEEPQNEDDIDFNAYNLNVTKYTMAFTILNESEIDIMGETTYLENYSNATIEEKEEKNHLINCSNDDYNDTVEMLHADNATGFILIRDNVSLLKNWSINLPGVAVSQQNGSKLKNLTQNGTVNIFISDYNISQGTGILDVYHCIDDLTLFEKKIWLVNSDWLENKFNILVKCNHILPAAAFLLCSPVYPQTHFQYPYASNKILAGEDASYSRLIKPIISINGSVVLDGQNKDVWGWVQENYYTDHPVTLNYEFTQMKNPAVESYIVYCDIQGKNTDEWLLLSGGHYDGWFGQMTCDNAVGVAQMLGILKYFNDNDITPKLNTRFIFHPGEENVARGSISHVFNMSNREVLSKAKYIINLCQLGHKYPASFRINTTIPRLFDKNLQKIVEEITTISGYDEKYESKGYKVSIGGLLSNGTTDCVPYTFLYNHLPQVDLQYINFCKDSFPMYHQTGVDHTKGDTLSEVDRDDINATVDIIWNVSKYFSVDPDCHFDSITYQRIDSPNDEDEELDTIEAAMPIQSILPQDKIRVKAELRRDFFPYNIEHSITHDYIITDETSNYEIDITLPPDKPEGNYILELSLYNSTGRINVILWPILHNDPNDSAHSGSLHLHPRGNQAPSIPTRPEGPISVKRWQQAYWGSTSPDPNDDRMGQKWYWNYDTSPNIHINTGLYDTDGFYLPHTYSILGTHQIEVKAYDEYSTLLHPYETDFSEPLDVVVTPWCDIIEQQQTHQEGLIHVVEGQPFQFYGELSGGENNDFEWNFNDRTRCSTEQNPEHTYSDSGMYNVTFNVTDETTQLIGRTYVQVRVSDIDSNFNMNYYHGAAPETIITFWNTSKAKTGNHIDNVTWDFDDGTISYASNVNHSYEDSGDYNVTLTVKDNENNIDVDYAILHITSNPKVPEIRYVQSPGVLPPDSEATILAEIVPTDRNLSNVTVNITTPNGTVGNYTMTEIIENIYIYTLDNTSQNGQFNFTIWATDIENNTNSSTGNFTMIVPLLSYETPTPSNYAIRNQNWVDVNVTVLDPLNTSAFIDWNHSLKGYWPMDTYNTTGVNDNSTYENFGVFEGGMNPTNVKNGRFGDALEFDGYNDDVDLGANSNLSLGTGDFTFMIWEKSHQTSYGNKAVLLTNRPSDASMKGYLFGVQNTPYLYVTQSTGNNITLSGKTDVTDSSWHHITFVRRGTNHSIYVDGVYDAGVTGSIKNISNNQHTYLSYGHMGDCAYFDGLLDEPQLFNRALSREEINASYNNGLYLLYHNFIGLTEGDYSYSAHAIDTSGNMSQTETRTVTIDFKPQTTDVSASPHTVGFGYNVTIAADVTDTGSDVSSVSVNITYPDHTQMNYTMAYVAGDTYQYVFTDTWLVGQYNYTIWATDNSSNINSSSGHHFHVSAQASMSIATLKDSYSGTQYINITDPPNPSENYTLVDRGLTWDKYYDATTGQNILEVSAGPINYHEEGTWVPINNTINELAENHPAYVYGYRSGNNRGLYGAYFKSNAQLDWPVAFTYNKSNDPTIYAVRSKLIGVGYVDPQSNWAYQFLQNVQNSQGQTNGYSITYPGVFSGTDVTWSYSNTGLKEEITMSNATKSVLQSHPPSQYALNDASSYLVFITKLDYQNLNLWNGSGVLDGNVTISDIGVDFKDILGQFKCALPLGEAYELNNETARQKLTYRIIHLNGNTYLLSGLKVADLNAMTFPVVVDPTLTVYSTSSDGYIYKSGSVYSTIQSASSGTVDSSSSYLTIGQKKVTLGPTYYVYRGFVFFNTSILTSNAYLDNATLSLYKKDDYSTTDFDITIQNGQPTYPHNPMQTGDYFRNYYSGNGGTLGTSRFTSGYNAITMSNLSWINKTGITKLCLRSSRDISGTAPTGNEYVNVYSNEFLGMNPPRLVINYRNQSKIKNTGSTDIKGYLLIQVQFYNTSQVKWVIDNDTINETTTRTITSGNQLALDTIFNGHVRASDLTHSTGTYRVYTTFRDLDGNILRTNDGTELKAWWQFSKT